MAQYYDVTLKAILKELPRRFFKILTGFEVVKFLDVQLPSVEYRQPDLLVELPDDSLLHIELQSSNDSDMEWRMHYYFCMIYHTYKKVPRQLLLYVGDKELKMGNGIDLECLQFKYRAMDIREINAIELSQSKDHGDRLLSILCTTQDIDATIKDILAGAYPMSSNERDTYVLKLLFLARLRGLAEKTEKEVKNMPVILELSDEEIHKDFLYKEGTRRGKLEGKLEGLIEGMLDIKYGADGLALMTFVKEMTSIDKMARFKDLIKRSKTIDELKEFLTST